MFSKARQRSYTQKAAVNPSGVPSHSIMNRGNRFFRGGVLMDVLLLVVFLILAYVFISRRNYMNELEPKSLDAVSSIATMVKQKKQQLHDEGSAQHMIDARVKKITDARTPECKNIKYKTEEQVSIVTVFFDYSFHDLKATLSSVMQNTPSDLFSEILIIDDASTLDYIVDKSQAYVKTIDKARLIRNTDQLWTSGSRMLGLREAKSDIVVFLEPNVLVTAGWLEPLIDTLTKERKAIVIPHFDYIKDPVSYTYQKTAEGLATTMSWSFSMRVTSGATKQEAKNTLWSPVNRGNALAVLKSSFLAMGGYDEGFSSGGGVDLEMSLRCWLCGYKILIHSCSRVGVVNLMDPVKVTQHKNIRRIAELWLSGRKNLVLHNTGVTDVMSEDEQKSVTERKEQLDQLDLKCQDIEWFFQEVAGDLPTPSENALHFGVMKCKTGRCARVGDDKRVDLGECQTEQYNIPSSRMVFEYTTDNLLTSGGQCLTVQPTAYILLEDCVAEARQKWQFKDGKMINEWSQYCMMHVTDPDKATDGKRQIAMAQDCNTASDIQFITYEFITF